MSDLVTSFGKGYIFGRIIMSRPVRFLWRWTMWICLTPIGVGNVLEGKFKVGFILLAIVAIWMWRRWEWHQYNAFYDEEYE